MLKRCCVVIICVCSFLITNGCLEIEAPSETMEIPSYSNADEIFNKYKKMLRENKTPKELLNFLEKNISKLHESSADIAIARVIELQKNLITKYEKKLLNEKYSQQLENIETKETHDIPDKNVRNMIKDIKENGFKIMSNKKVEIDYVKINKIAADHVSTELKDYIKIESDESNKNYSKKDSLDSCLNGKPDKIEDFVMDLATMLNETYNYTYTYKHSPYIIRVKELQSQYLQIFLFGSPNYSSFKYYQGSGIKNNTISKPWQSAYLKVKNIYTKRYGFGVVMGNYYNELSKNNNILTQELYKYMNNIINNQDI